MPPPVCSQPAMSCPQCPAVRHCPVPVPIQTVQPASHLSIQVPEEGQGCCSWVSTQHMPEEGWWWWSSEKAQAARKGVGEVGGDRGRRGEEYQGREAWGRKCEAAEGAVRERAVGEGGWEGSVPSRNAMQQAVKPALSHPSISTPKWS